MIDYEKLLMGICPELSSLIHLTHTLTESVHAYANYDWEEEVARGEGYVLEHSKRHYACEILNIFSLCFSGKTRDEVEKAFELCKPVMEDDFTVFTKSVYAFANYSKETETNKSELVLAILKSLSNAFNGSTRNEVSSHLESLGDTLIEAARKYLI